MQENEAGPLPNTISEINQTRIGVLILQRWNCKALRGAHERQLLMTLGVANGFIDVAPKAQATEGTN